MDGLVSRGLGGAEEGLLSVMVGGDKKIFEKAKPLINSYAKLVGQLGKSGSGQLEKRSTKYVSQDFCRLSLKGLTLQRKRALMETKF